MNEPPLLYPYLSVCERGTDGWVEEGGANGSLAGELGEGDQRCPYIAHWEEEVPAGKRVAIVRFAGREYEVPVVGGHFLFVAWGVPYRGEWPEAVGYL